MPGHGHANIDHIAIGPAGVLVIDSKTHRGKVSTDRIGGLFAPRRTVLLIDGRDQSCLVDGIERQVGYVGSALAEPSIEVHGALCFVHPEGLPWRQLNVRGVVVDGPKPIARLAARPGSLDAHQIREIWERLGRAFPPA